MAVLARAANMGNYVLDNGWRQLQFNGPMEWDDEQNERNVDMDDNMGNGS